MFCAANLKSKYNHDLRDWPKIDKALKSYSKIGVEISHDKKMEIVRASEELKHAEQAFKDVLSDILEDTNVHCSRNDPALQFMFINKIHSAHTEDTKNSNSVRR